MSPHQCSSDRELAQRRNTHKFRPASVSLPRTLQLRSRLVESIFTLLGSLAVPRETQNIHKATSSHICTRRSCLRQPERTAPWLGSAGRSRSKPRDVKSQMRFSGLEKCICLWLSSCVYLWKAIETQEYFPKIKRALRQHSRQGHQQRDTCPKAF